MRWVRRAVLGASALAVALSWWWVPLALRPLAFFRVRRVEVFGARYVAPEAVVRALRLGSEASVFDPRAPLERALMRTGGFTAVAVRRRLPATLEVEVREQEPVALARGAAGLVALARDGRPLPYDLSRGDVDAPIVAGAAPTLAEALGRIEGADAELFADVASARERGGELVLDLTQGRVRLNEPVDPLVLRAVSAVRRDLVARGIAWRELDGRFRGWVVVRRPAASARSG